MNLDALSYVRFGDVDGLQEMLFENDIEHQVFHDTLGRLGIYLPKYPISDADIHNLDDWLLLHNQEHQAIAQVLNLDNPFQLLNSDWRVEDDFYDWLAVHQTLHQNIITALGIAS